MKDFELKEHFIFVSILRCVHFSYPIKKKMLFLKYVTEKQLPYFSGKQTSLLQFDIGKHWMDNKIGKNTFYLERMVFNEFPLK